MQLDKLRLDLRPRSNAQGLDLGFSLLHAGGADVWRAWMALWLPLSALAVLLSWYNPDLALGWLLPWWLRPLLERAPLHVLARQVFGEQASWRDALRAWPRELGGGWFRMLTWWRPFMAGRGLHQPVWVLERARGKVATARRATIARNGTGGAALMFGSMCASFEFVLMMGVLALLGLFMPGETANPFALLTLTNQGPLQAALGTAAWCLACAIIGPIYTACTFTLYLNRRATLEAWDLEIVLRQLRPPARPAAARQAAAVLMAAPLLAMALLGMPPPVQAAGPAAGAKSVATDCAPPEGLTKQDSGRGPDRSPQQAALRRQLDQVFAHQDLRGYRCGEQWELRVPPAAEKEKEKPKSPPLLPRWMVAILAGGFKVTLIAGAVALVAWLLWRYAAPLRFNFAAAAEPKLATEVGGLDIREESLPADVAGAVRALWQQGQQRAALALLYRATLSRLVSRQSLKLHHGATEGECLAQARSAHAAGALDSASLALADQATTLWLNAAYGARWPAAESVAALCTRWQAHFDREAA
ncbi:DUF4129 domain-containing protein [Duganella sp. Root198D2]|uniref:DUF4129 domain-containing protein n=1 Tax=Duganella sp. Root198D2 TaxID=1736489 RepID=UPI00070C9CA8|nr:DUF4129 domain-containing protein [Duganella sp. Root198D2]KRB83421.1 hypothetical protein ASE26_13225 [Duganella sp. Root198D2]